MLAGELGDQKAGYFLIHSREINKRVGKGQVREPCSKANSGSNNLLTQNRVSGGAKGWVRKAVFSTLLRERGLIRL
jgi:hypothetical protein